MCDFRKTGRSNRKNLSQDRRKIFTEIINNSLYREIGLLKNIMIYNTIDGEPEIVKKDGFNYIYPKIENDEIVPYSGENFTVGKYNILEPTGDKFEGTIDVCVVPMCAFDENFNRLGFGKGYYDRFLYNKKLLKIGVAFNCQKCSHIVEKSTDVKMDIIITEKEIIKRI